MQSSVLRLLLTGGLIMQDVASRHKRGETTECDCDVTLVDLVRWRIFIGFALIILPFVVPYVICFVISREHSHIFKYATIWWQVVINIWFHMFRLFNWFWFKSGNNKFVLIIWLATFPRDNRLIRITLSRFHLKLKMVKQQGSRNELITFCHWKVAVFGAASAAFLFDWQNIVVSKYPRIRRSGSKNHVIMTTHIGFWICTKHTGKLLVTTILRGMVVQSDLLVIMVFVFACNVVSDSLGRVVIMSNDNHARIQGLL